MKDIEELKECCILKGVGEPEHHLGGDVMFLGDQWQAEGVNLAFSAQTHVKNIVPKFEELFGLTMKSVKTPMSPDFEARDGRFTLCVFGQRRQASLHCRQSQLDCDLGENRCVLCNIFSQPVQHEAARESLSSRTQGFGMFEVLSQGKDCV